jgi:predicted metal-dependent phosphoesterase TrpH
MLLVPGVEVSTSAGHLLAYGVMAAPPRRRPLQETIDWIRAAGGEAVLPHPFRWTHGVGGRTASSVRVPALESINGQNSESSNRAADRLAEQRAIGRTGGSDAHTPGGVGRAFTVLDESPASIDDLLEAVRRGRTRAGGRSLTISGRLRWSVRNTALRVRRGFRAV